MEDGERETYITTGEQTVTYNETGASRIQSFDLWFQPLDFSSAGVFAYGGSRQYMKLQWYMNMYEKFRLAVVRWTYIPRWTQLIPSPPQQTYFQGSGLQSSYTYPNNDQGGNPGSFQNQKEIVIVGDKTDTDINNTNDTVQMDEYYELRNLSHARQFSSIRSARGVIFPAIKDDAGSIYGSGTTAPSYNQSWDGLVDIDSSGFNQSQIAQLTTIDTPWQPTRVNDLTSSATIGTEKLNLNTTMFGMKFYIYDPYSVATNGFGTTFTLGRLRYDYVWQFRSRDYRRPITAVTFTAGVVPLSTALHMEAMASIKANTVMTSNGKPRVVFKDPVEEKSPASLETPTPSLTVESSDSQPPRKIAKIL